MIRKPISSDDLPKSAVHSVLMPGEERIRGNVFFPEPITGMPCGKVHTVYDVFRRGKEQSEDGPAVGEIRNGIFHWTKYSEVICTSNRLGAGLLSLGKQTKRVGVAGINSLRYTLAVHSLVNFSITSVPLYHNSKMEDLCYIIGSCQLEIVYCDTAERAQAFVEKKASGEIPVLSSIILLHGLKDDVVGAGEACIEIWEFDEVLARGVLYPREDRPPTPDDVYVICHTSGTTGRPKGVQTTHRNLLAAVGGLYWQWCCAPNNISFDSSEVYFSFLSLAHIYEHLMQNFIAYCGGHVGIYSGDTTRLLPDIQLLRPTVIALVPRLLNKFYESVHARMATQSFIVQLLFGLAKWWKLRMLASGEMRYDTIWDRIVFSKISAMLGGRIRLLTTGGAPVSAEVKNFSRIAYGAPLFEGYGQTECGAAGTLNIPSDMTPLHVGGPAPWAQIKLIDAPELGYYAKDDKGEVCFRGAAVMSGYLGDASLTAKTVDDQGWLHTGDIGQWLPNGSLAIIDRKNAFFKLAQGDFVAPELIENVYGQSALIFVAGRTTRSFLVAVIVINVAALRTALSNADQKLHHLITLPDSDLLEARETRDFVLGELNTLAKGKGLTPIELARAVHLTTEEFTAEGGFLTSTLKIRRHILTKHYEDVIGRLYGEVQSA
ncbi:acs-3 [Pristionchus pacificus]|uniref:Acs-3 n=1 Tax=Pristionchus pacificus TaxID=54126 RepID=A0A454XWV4_PRIPA|nr:acs-3 [Pristionchus pacificus]|eukprot:PDM73511.1 acs-3 [Pristionchus pacificus]